MLKSFRQGLSAPEQSAGLGSPAELGNLQLYIDAQEFNTITFASGSGDGDPIESVAGVNGTLGVIDESNGYNYFYKAAGLYGKPAFRKPSNQPRSIFRDENQGNPDMYTTQATWVYFLTGIFDGTQDSGNIMSMNSLSYSRINVSNPTTMEYELDENRNPVVITGTYDLSGLTMVALSYDSLSSLNIKINEGSFQNLNPDDGYDGGSVRFGGRNAFLNGLYLECYGGLVYDRALDTIELNQLYDWGMARYGSS